MMAGLASLGYKYIHNVYPVALIPKCQSCCNTKHTHQICFHITSLVATLSLLLVVAHLLGLLQQLRGVVDSAESTDSSVDALVHEVAGNDNPEGVHQDEVAPVVSGLRASVGDVQDVVVEERGCVVENVAIELAQRDDKLQGIAQRVVDSNEIGGEEGERAPESLQTRSVYTI